ncbi:MAG: hypothetical protein HKP30_05190 [Myxococcales bacterium]|nr:hypothetical protein [Myxococcales bacterium]
MSCQRRATSGTLLLLLTVAFATPVAADDDAASEFRARDLVRETFTLDHLSSDWEVLFHDPDHAYPADGRLRIDPEPVTDWEALHRIPNLVRYRFPLAGRRITARARLEVAIDAPGHGGALVLYQDDQNWVELAFRGEREGGELVRVLRLTRRFGGETETRVRRHGRGASGQRERITLVLEREGDSFRALMEIPMGPPGVLRRGVVGEVSAPGLGDLQLILKAARAEPASVPLDAQAHPGVLFDDVVAVGFSADAGLGDAPESLRVAFATDFRDTASFRRDFTVMRPQSGSLALEDGLELVARYGIPGDRWTPVRNLVVLNRPLPRGSFDVEVEVDATFTSPHDDVGIMLYGEKGNALYVGHWSIPGKAEDGRRAYLRTVAGGSGQTRFSPDPATRTDVEATTLVFRLERNERGYVAWVDVAGRGWVRVGEAELELVEPRVGLFARSARDRGTVPGAGVRFARLWVMTEAGPAGRP